jgi:hypothetical protein
MRGMGQNLRPEDQEVESLERYVSETNVWEFEEAIYHQKS